LGHPVNINGGDYKKSVTGTKRQSRQYGNEKSPSWLQEHNHSGDLEALPQQLKPRKKFTFLASMSTV